MDKPPGLSEILRDAGLARFGDSLLNFAFSITLTEKTGHATGTKVSDKTLAEAAVKAGLRKYLPKRIGRGDVANSLEALLGFVWIQKMMNLDEILLYLKARDSTPVQNFANLASQALIRLER